MFHLSRHLGHNVTVGATPSVPVANADGSIAGPQNIALPVDTLAGDLAMLWVIGSNPGGSAPSGWASLINLGIGGTVAMGGFWTRVTAAMLVTGSFAHNANGEYLLSIWRGGRLVELKTFDTVDGGVSVTAAGFTAHAGLRSAVATFMASGAPGTVTPPASGWSGDLSPAVSVLVHDGPYEGQGVTVTTSGSARLGIVLCQFR